MSAKQVLSVPVKLVLPQATGKRHNRLAVHLPERSNRRSNKTREQVKRDNYLHTSTWFASRVKWSEERWKGGSFRHVSVTGGGLSDSALFPSYHRLFFLPLPPRDHPQDFQLRTDCRLGLLSPIRKSPGSIGTKKIENPPKKSNTPSTHTSNSLPWQSLSRCSSPLRTRRFCSRRSSFADSLARPLSLLTALPSLCTSVTLASRHSNIS